jgi:hypothetical protein
MGLLNRQQNRSVDYETALRNLVACPLNEGWRTNRLQRFDETNVN